ncbi:MAG: selenocysteine-specific translation elongation factor [Sandaracinaceae bacterium]|nr:selenocysteine-specific translation elongation factor [Sandaracinaceae bacterium]
MIVGTAGHVDHGKTTLIEALTGVNCDRLPEERARGLTIELGFAPWTLPDGRRVSVVDVPGHARFARTMAAGALGMDAVLLVVAADEGWMPQTSEHVATCEVLGVTRAVVALTRADRAIDVETSRRFVRERLDRTRLAGAPIVPVCAPRGEGLDALARAVAALPIDPSADRARPPWLPVDRIFTRPGFGTVVTGSLLAGALRVGDHVELFPARRVLRVRTLHVHGVEVERAEARTRLALNLAGIGADEIARGGVIGAPGGACVGRVLDVELEWLAHHARPLARARALSFGHGPARAEARVTCDRPIAPGGRGTARLHLDRELALAGGARFVLRGPPDRRFGGIAVAARARRRAAAAPRGVRAGRVAAVPSLDALLDEAGARGVEPSTVGPRLGVAALPDGPRRFGEAALDAAARAIVEAARACVASDASARGVALDAPEVRRVGPIAEVALARAVARGELVRDGALVRPADHAPDRAPLDALAASALAAIRAAGLEGPREHDLGRALGASERALGDALARLEAAGAVARALGFVFATQHLGPLARAVAREALARGPLPFGFLKDHAGLSRKHAMPIWTWLDRIGVTRRVGEARAAGPAARAHAN